LITWPREPWTPRAPGARRLFAVEQLPLLARDRAIQRRPQVSGGRFGHVHAAARRMHFDLHPRFAMILGERHLRVVRSPRELGHFFDQLSGVRAQVFIDLGMPGGNGNTHDLNPLLPVRQCFAADVPG
jgi:hypothetical protein